MTSHVKEQSTTKPNRLNLTTMLILMIPPLLWAGNFVVGRAVRNDLPPMALSFGRWVIALLCILPFAWKPMKRDISWYLANYKRVIAISLVGVAAFNSLVYSGLHYTAATNGILLNSTIPILIVLLGSVFYAQTLTRFQALGLVLSFCGVFTIILRGELSHLLSLTFSKGDLIVFTAMICWAFYTLWLRSIPREIDRTGFMGVQIIVGLISLFPFFIWEMSTTGSLHWNQNAILALGYVGIFPSVIAYLLYNIGVARVGAVRAGLSIHLLPVFGTVLSILFLHESLHLYHLIGALAIFAGILFANRV